MFLTHDAQTVPNFVHDMIRDGVAPPRGVVIPEQMPIGPAVEELVLLLLAGTDVDWQRNPMRLPL